MTEKKKRSTPKAVPPSIKIPEDLPTAYANLVRIAHTPSEMMFDFARILPGDKQAQVVARVLMSPLGAKLLLRALTDNLAKFETSFGEIVIPKQQSLADHLFRPPPPSEDKPEEKDK